MATHRVMVSQVLHAVTPPMHHEMSHALAPLVMDLAPVRCALRMRIQHELIRLNPLKHQVKRLLLPPRLSLSQVIYLQTTINEVNHLKPIRVTANDPDPERVKRSGQPTPIQVMQVLRYRRLPVPISEDMIEVAKPVASGLH
jgi:hypothetical protein